MSTNDSNEPWYPTFIPNAGACMVSKHIMKQEGTPRFMYREESMHPADNGWRVLSDIDTNEYLNDGDNWAIADFNEICAFEPAVILIYTLPVGSDVQVVKDEQGIRIVNSHTGQPVPQDQLYYPPGPPS